MNARTLPALPRLTEGVLNAHARSVRAALEILESHQQRPYRDDLTAVLSELDFEIDGHRGYPALDFTSAQDMVDALVDITAKLMKDEPRKWKAIMGCMHVDGLRLYWGLQPWVNDYPDAA